jgi:phospholipid/cholesterol/gamma-HCH transport system permease protein
MTTTSSADNPPDVPPYERRLRRFLDHLVAPIFVILNYFGERAIMLGDALAGLVRRPFRLRLFLDQMEFVGVGSLPIISLVGFFSGAVSAQQAITALRIFNQERFVGATVGISLAQELAPVFTGLMITARAGSGMATELGSMRITEQIDALSTFAVDPIQYLVTPRVIATTLIMPIMTMVFNIVGLVGAYLFSIYFEHIDLGQFTEQFTYWTDPKDYIIGASKALVFGLVLSVAACYQGFNVRGGAKEVGLATTRAVVAGSVSILVSDYFLIDAFHILWPYKS